MSLDASSQQELEARRLASPGFSARLGHAFANPSKRSHHGQMIRRTEGGLASSSGYVFDFEKRAPADCTSGGLYKAPAAGATVPSANETTFVWDNACLGTGVDKIDIYMYAPLTPTTNNLPIHAWKGIPAAKGSYNVKLAPRWWNATASIALNLNIVPSDNQPWDSSNPIGPTWTATYEIPPPGVAPPKDALPGDTSLTESVISVFYSGGSLTKGGMAAAIICPLVVVSVVLGLWIRKLHINRNNKTADWADHMDQRMSRISLDWMAGGDGSAGPVPGSRPASFIRPPSNFYPRPSLHGESSQGHGNFAGRGAGHNLSMDVPREMSEAVPRPRSQAVGGDSSMRQSRISFANETAGDRVSRISYANTSEGHLRSHKTSASIPRVGQMGAGSRRSHFDSYHDPDAPAMPKISKEWRDTRHEETEDLTIMSPTQNEGATPLGNVDSDRMRSSLEASRALGGGAPTSRALTPAEDESDRAFRNSVLKYPALSMITTSTTREDGEADDQDDEDEGRLAAYAQQGLRPISGLSEGGDSAYAPTEQTRASEYIDQGAYARTAGAHAISPDHPARQATQNSTGMAPPSNLASPDDALKQYAALRSAGPSGSNNGGMRTLFTPDAAANANGNKRGSSIYIDAPGNLGHRPQQGSINTAGSSILSDDVVGYNEAGFTGGR